MSNSKMRFKLLGATALAATLGHLGVDAANAAPPDLVVSAPLPGATYTITGDETWGATIIGSAEGDSGTLNVGPGATLQTGVVGNIGTIIGGMSGSFGNVIVRGPNTNWTDIGESVIVGLAGTGTLDIADGAVLTANVLTIGYGMGAQGTATVSGVGSSVVAINGATLGSYPGSTGSLTVQDGASFETVGGSLNISSGSSLNVTGSGTQVRVGTLHSGTPDTWSDSDGWLYVGSGAVQVSAGAYLETDGTYVSGVQAGGSASMTLTGPGTALNSHLLIYVAGDGNGTNGDGSMVISDGATAIASTVGIGVDEFSTGSLLLTGTGTSLTTIPHGTFVGNVYAGSGGNGTITLQDGASLTAANQLRIAYEEGSTGKLIIGAAEGETAAAPGSVTATNGVVFGSGDGQLIFNHTSNNYNFDSTIEGTNGEIRQIAGTTNLTGNSQEFFGNVSVLGGVLLANGDISGANVTVSGGVLGGSGTVGNLTINSGGAVSPGNSPGTLTVNGDVSFASGSTYIVDVEASGAHDLIAATGTATLNGGTVQINAESGVDPFTTYAILTAAGGVTGTFDGAAVNYAFLDPLLTYDANDVYLKLMRNAVAFATLAGTPNQQASAVATESLGFGNPVYDAVLRLTAMQAPGAFDALSGEAYASAASIIAQDSIFLRQAVGARVWQGLAGSAGAAADGPTAAKLGAATGLTVWGQGYGAWGEVDGDGNAASVSRDIGGFFAGVDGAVADGVRLGVVGGYGRSTFTIDDRASSGDIDTYDLGAYGGARIGGLGLLGAATYSWNDVSMGRTVAFPGYLGANSASFDIGTTQIFGEANWRFDLTPAGSESAYGKAWLEPFVSPAYVNLSSGDIAETGSTSALIGSTDGEDLFYVTLGARAATTIKLANAASLTPRVSLAWQHAFGDVNPAASLAFASGSLPFAVSGVPIAQDTAVIGAGIDYGFNETLSAGLSYNGQFGDGLQDNAVKGTLNVKF